MNWLIWHTRSSARIHQRTVRTKCSSCPGFPKRQRRVPPIRRVRINMLLVQEMTNKTVMTLVTPCVTLESSLAKTKQPVTDAKTAKSETKSANNDLPNSIFGGATTFSASQRTVPPSSILGSLFSGSPTSPEQRAAESQPAPKLVKLDR